MTLEGEEPDRDETPAPPARTRWSEDAADDEAGLMPPYVPGGRTSAATQPEAGAPAPAPPEEPRQPPEPEPEPETGSEFPFDAMPDDGEPTVAASPAGEGQGHQEGDFPFDAFDLEGDVDESPVESAAMAEEAPTVPASPSDELAGRLERLADALRRDGRAGVDRELGSGDRLTSLLAGVVAGYLAGLDD